MIEAVFR